MKEDKYLWAEFRNNEESALSYIYNHNVDFLFYYGKKFSSDENFILDVIQDLFYDLIKYRKNISETDNIRLYLIKSFRRNLLRGIENKKKSVSLHSTYSLEPEIIFSIEDEWIAVEEQTIRTKQLKKGLLELSVKQREVFYYKFSLGYEYIQICEIMNITSDSARQLVSRGVKSLKQYLSDK